MHVYIKGLWRDCKQDAGLEEILFPHIWHVNPYCLYIKQDRRRWDVCIRNNRCLFVALERGNGALCAGHCPFGVLEVYAPILLRGRLVGAIGAGCYAGDPEVAAARFDLAEQRGADGDRLRRLYRETMMPRTAERIAAEGQLAFAARAVAAMVMEGTLTEKPEAVRSHEMVARALAYIRAHASEPLAVPDIAAYLNVSESHLQHLFKHIHGQSVLRSVKEIRMNWASRLLDNAALPIGDVAALCGFSDSNYFSTVFARHFGVPPTLYRKRRQGGAQP